MPTGKERKIENWTMTFEGKPILEHFAGEDLEDIPPEERTDWETESDARIALIKRAWHLRCENAYLKGKVEVLEGFATRRLEIKPMEIKEMP